MVNLEQISQKKFCVVGDLIIDYYRILVPSRISPEAPVLIFDMEKEYVTPGGAANVANNLLALGASPENVTLCSVVGDDWEAIVGSDVFVGCKLLLSRQPGRRTTVKERLVTSRQQLMRIDLQDRCLVTEESAKDMVDGFESVVEECDTVVFSDYDHGVMHPLAVRKMVLKSKDLGIPTVVDSKAPDTIRKYSGCTIAIPTSKEARTFSGVAEHLKHAPDEMLATSLLKMMKLKAVGMTLGREGILLASTGGVRRYPPLAQDPNEEVADVAGAGDTVAATMAMGLSLCLDYDTMTKFANVVAGIVVRKKGVATASKEEVITVMSKKGEMECLDREI